MNRTIPGSRCVALAVALCAGWPHGLLIAQEAPTGPGFRIKEERRQTGTNILRDSVSGGALPYDRTYAELTPAQQQLLRSKYVEMGEGDEPPYPLEGLGPLYRAIARANELAGAAVGPLDMDVFVDETGRPSKVELVRSPDPRLAKDVAAIAMLTRFKPALCKGKPCAMGFPVSVVFNRR